MRTPSLVALLRGARRARVGPPRLFGAVELAGARIFPRERPARRPGPTRHATLSATVASSGPARWWCPLPGSCADAKSWMRSGSVSSTPARRQPPGRISDDDRDCRPAGRQSVSGKVCWGVGLQSLALGQMLPISAKKRASRWMLTEPPTQQFQLNPFRLKTPCLAQRDTSGGALSPPKPQILAVRKVDGQILTINGQSDGAPPPAPPSDMSALSLLATGRGPNHD